MNQNQNQRYEVRVDFPGYECRVAFPGYECRMAFPGACTLQNLASGNSTPNQILNGILKEIKWEY